MNPVLTGFIPSVHGFHFDNSTFTDCPLFKIAGIPIGDASNGLCGGMSLAAMDYFLSGTKIPSTTKPPKYGDELFHYLTHRLVDSFQLPFGPLKWYLWQTVSGKTQARWTWNNLSKIIRSIDKGMPVLTGIVRRQDWNIFNLGHNHQIVVTGYEGRPNEIVLNVYDSNYPDRDDLTISVLDDRLNDDYYLEYSTGETVTGCLVMPYRGSSVRLPKDK